MVCATAQEADDMPWLHAQEQFYMFGVSDERRQRREALVRFVRGHYSAHGQWLTWKDVRERGSGIERQKHTVRHHRPVIGHVTSLSMKMMINGEGRLGRD
jgi:hypothetical protein